MKIKIKTKILILFSFLFIAILSFDYANKNNNLDSISKSIKIKYIEILSYFNESIRNQDCFKIERIDNIPSSSTILIGHAYGSPLTATDRLKKGEDFLAPKVIKFLDETNDKNVEKVIFTGDVFFKPDKKKWQQLYKMYSNRFEIVVAPGNHDVGYGENNIYRKIFDKNVLKSTLYPYSFTSSGFQIIVGDNTIGKTFFQKKLYTLIHKQTKLPIILAIHHVPVEELINIGNDKLLGKRLDVISSSQLISNFKNKEITIISGDAGAFFDRPRLFCKKFGNISIIINGIGEIGKDHVIVLSKGKIYIKDI